jgi:hypothetical protein
MFREPRTFFDALAVAVVADLVVVAAFTDLAHSLLRDRYDFGF